MDIKTGRLTAKYAQALFNLDGKQMVEDDFWAIKKTVQCLRQNMTILTYFNAPHASENSQLIKLFLAYFKLPAKFSALILLLQKQQRVFLLKNILEEFLALYLINQQQIFFKITSYPALDDSQTNQALGYLAQATGAKILYEQHVDPTLIAGLKMQSVTFLYNDTIQNRLQKIHRKLIRQN